MNQGLAERAKRTPVVGCLWVVGNERRWLWVLGTAHDTHPRRYFGTSFCVPSWLIGALRKSDGMQVMSLSGPRLPAVAVGRGAVAVAGLRESSASIFCCWYAGMLRAQLIFRIP